MTSMIAIKTYDLAFMYGPSLSLRRRRMNRLPAALSFIIAVWGTSPQHEINK